MNPLLARIQATALDPDQRDQVSAGLERAKERLSGGDAGGARRAVEAVHPLSQNDLLLHVRTHTALIRVAVAEGRPLAALGEVPHVVWSAPSSAVRRLAGLLPGVQGGKGLIDTWRRRRQLRAFGAQGGG